MGTLNAIYVRAPKAKLLPHALGAELVIEEPGLPFVVIDKPAGQFTPPRGRLEKLSRELETDVLWLSFQSTAGAFRYVHWQGGALLRELAWGCDRQGTWDAVSGEPEAWETVTAALRTAEAGPVIDAHDTARVIAGHYRLPGWSLTHP